MKNNMLFITEKWCDAKPEMGLTNNYHNLFGSLKHCGLEVPFNVLHLDEAQVSFNTHVDKLIPAVVDKYKPEIVMMSLLGKSPMNPTLECFEQLKKMGLYVAVMWPDTGFDWGFPQIEQLGKLVDLHISWDNASSEVHNTKPKYPNHLWLWVPQDDKLYFKNVHQDIPVSFIGSPRYQERQIYLSHAQQAQVPLLIRGGQREEKLSAEQYAQLIRRSKISINFPHCPGGFDQCKGRVFEALACNSMLLERKNDATSRLFTPGQDYVEYTDPNDFVEKIRYYTTHEEERAKIAAQGFKTFQEKYTARKFWETILERIQNDRHISVHAGNQDK